MPKSFEPDDRVEVLTRSDGWKKSDKTNAELTLGSLTDEVLRDVARNESSPRSWRKAAVKFLVNRKSKYQHHLDFKELLNEINEETEAEQEVKAAVESAIEESLSE